MIEVLHFGLSPNFGGIERYIYDTWTHMDHDKIHFSFIDIIKPGGEPRYFEDFTGCTFYKITPRRTSNWKNKTELERLFREHHFDILHFHVNSLSYLTPVTVALRHGCKVIVHSHNSTINNIRQKVMHAVNKRRLQSKEIRRIAVSGLAGEWMFGKDYVVLHNDIDTDRFVFSAEARATVRGELGIADGTFVVGTVGRFSAQKNPGGIVDIFAAVLKRDPAARLLWVGEGELRQQIEQRLREEDMSHAVIMTGARTDVERLLQAMDVFILPSVYEGYPIALIEAQAAGLPCFCSETVTNEAGLNGLCTFLPLDQPELWADSILDADISRDRSPSSDEPGTEKNWEYLRGLYEKLAAER